MLIAPRDHVHLMGPSLIDSHPNAQTRLSQWPFDQLLSLVFCWALSFSDALERPKPFLLAACACGDRDFFEPHALRRVQPERMPATKTASTWHAGGIAHVRVPPYVHIEYTKHSKVSTFEGTSLWRGYTPVDKTISCVRGHWGQLRERCIALNRRWHWTQRRRVRGFAEGAACHERCGAQGRRHMPTNMGCPGKAEIL